MRVFILYFLFLISTSGASQNWVSAGIPLPPAININIIKTAYTDTLNDKIYIGGSIFMGTNWQSSLGIYDGISKTWNFKDTFNNQLNSITIYNNELYVGGSFSTVNSVYTSSLAKWNGSNWINIADTIWYNSTLGGIANIKVYNNELYVAGIFTKIGGINANGIAKWNGISWSDVNNFPNFMFTSGNFINDIAFYNGDIYAGGNFITYNGITDIAVYKNSTWQKVGTNDTLRGTFCGVGALEVYNNELYAGGLIWNTEGNVGHGIQKWNGTSWSAVGTGVQDINNITNNGTVQFFKLQSYKGKLYGIGTFTYAGNVIAPRIATWDGSKWCAIDRDIDQNFNSFCFYKDTLYGGTLDTLEQNQVNYFAKFIKGDFSYTDTCSVNFNSILQITRPDDISLYPNPATDHFNVSSSQVIDEIKVHDVLGQTLYQAKPNEKTVSVKIGKEGLYFVTVISGQQTTTRKLIVNH